jgi:8-oxo-dGTP pyrophosphatase MutT (NUDIX family)
MTADIATALPRALAHRQRTTLARPDKTVAAVLVPVFLAGGQPHLVYIRRAHDLPHHRGQIAFPGGRHQPEHDTTLEDTALREASEEIGLVPADVRLLGALDDTETVGSRFVITPFVGLVPYPYVWRPCPREVDTVFTVPLGTLAAPGAERQETWNFGGTQVPVAMFPVDGHVIWGVTQRITRNLLDVLAGDEGEN